MSSIADKLTTIAENVPKVYDSGKTAGYNEGQTEGYNSGYNAGKTAGYNEGYSAGQQSEYNRSWNNIQNNGSRADYSFFLAGGNIAMIKEKPKHKVIKPTSLYMFSYLSSSHTTEHIDFVALCEEYGVTFDTSNCTNWTYAFANSAIARLGVINAEGKALATQLFHSNYRIHTVDELKVSAGTTFNTNTFYNAQNLINLNVTGIIGQNGFNVQQSTKLSKASITSIINALSSTTSGLTVTLSKTAVTSAFGSTTATEWTNLVATKSNWTISLV